MERILSTRNVSVDFRDHAVLRGVSADFPSGAMTAVIGSNGAGKTTYLKAIAGMVRSTGEILFTEDGKRISVRDSIAYVPQLGSVHTRLTAYEMVLLGLVRNLKWHVTREQRAQVYETLEELNIADIAGQPFNTLSGGQRQLVYMGQSLIGRPKVLLLDEPTSALDLRHQLIVMDLAERYTRSQNAVTVFVVHDLLLASRYGRNLLVLKDGKTRAFGSAGQILTSGLIEEVYGVKARVERLPEGYLNVIPVSPILKECGAGQRTGAILKHLPPA